MKLLIINGPNLNLLGIREPEIYGQSSYEDLKNLVATTCQEHQIEYEIFQSNHEGALVDAIQAAYGIYDGIVINPAAYTHTSIALLDALKAVGIPAIEVHLSNIHERETFRQLSYVGMACKYTIMGKGIAGYKEAILCLKADLEYIF